MCFVFTLLLLGPRAAALVYWLGWPTRWDLAFDSFLVPFLGVLFLPWTTLMYVGVAPGGVNDVDYVFLGLAVAMDVISAGGGGRYSRSRY